ncbi:polysaccharide biosynthesis/export family protein [Qipengyuania sp. ASV99]|uniref:polysaccharide biosynthesis/export family protein n=1 Tax=Qipengyuania sp. ASV99 TaxID=3399681 RepID=UPI003A4C8408
MNFHPPFAALALATLLLAGCAKPVPLQSTEFVSVLESNELPTPVETTAKLGALDKVRIEVFGVEELTREVQIDGSGRMSYPFIGSIEVKGQAPADVERLIAQRLSEGYVLNPQVSVNLVDTVSQTIAIEGEVKSPGIYPAAGELTLLRTLALAGGPTQFAEREQVVIFREVGADRYAGVYDLDAVRRGQVADPQIFANDTIVLGDSPRRRTIDQLVTIAPALASPLVILFTRN